MIKLTKKEKDIIAEENQKLIHFTVNKFVQNTSSEYDEIFAISSLGFTKALNAYDKEKNIKFSTFAVKVMMNEILYYLRKEKAIKTNTISFSSIIATDKGGNNLTIEDIVDDENSELDTNLIKNEKKEALLLAISQLKELEQIIVLNRFGLINGNVITQKEIATKINMSQANISKMEKASMLKLKKILREANFTDIDFTTMP